MLNALRKGAAGWLAKILFALLVLSFAAWGVGDWTSGFRREKLAEVGGREITPQEFDRAYQAQIASFSNQIGRQLTSAEIRASGLTQRVLQNLVGNAAINIHAEKLNLGISNEAIVKNIHEEPSFEGENGKFSPDVFGQVLRTNGLSEPVFVDMQRKELIRQQLVGTLTQSAYAPRTLIDATHHFRNDERTLKYFILPPEAAGAIETPDETKLQTYYADHKRSFTAPEYRRAGALVLSAEKLKGNIALTDEELKAAFEANRKAYSVPERRTIQQLVFKDMAAAEDAARKLAGGADFMKLGEEIGLKETDINLGVFSREEFADRRVADAAFKLEKDKPSEPISGFAPVIVRVTEITPGSEKNFEEVKAQVRDQLAKERVGDEISKLYDQIEDDRAAGSTLTEIAKKLNLDFAEVTVNRQGVDREGKKVDLATKAPDVIKTLFESDVGVENNAVQMGEDGYIFADVLEIVPERQKPFEEVRDDVAKAWAEEEARTRLSAKADALIADLGKGKTLEEVAGAEKAEVKTSAPIKRSGAEPGLPISAIAQAFSLPEGGFGSAQTADRKGRVIFQVAAVKPAPALDDKGVEQLQAELGRGMGNDFFAQYVTGLQTSYGVQVSAKAIATATGQTTQ
jgi:peptidyl-prolyl cis-trans isomerase D